MKKRKWIYIVMIIVLALPVLWLHAVFNGNYVTKQLSKRTIKNYLEETYPESEYNLGKPFYNFKDGGYVFNVREIGDEEQREYEFVVVGLLGTNVHIDGIYQANLDYNLMERLGEEASRELKSVLQEEIPAVLRVGVMMDVLYGKYESDITWSKDFQPEEPMYVHIMIDASGLTREDVLEVTKQIQKLLEPYDYRRVTINANKVIDEIDDSALKYWTSFDHDKKIKLRHIKEE